ncbi:transketolase [Candidatus Woesearchaeota archaeon]|nr:transketolase [Candidatus Woesearchaeota archaeon]
MDVTTIKNLYLKAVGIREDVLHMLKFAGSGHLGGSFSAAELLSVLYFHELKLDPKHPNWEERDRFVLSKGHCCPGLYAVLAERGFFSKEEFKMLRKVNGNLQGHPERITPGVEFIAGFLGQGLSAGLGMALGFKRMKKNNRIYVMIGDGDNQEGQTWEAARFGVHNKLDNLVAIYDYNNLQSDDRTENILTIKDPEKQWTSFGWHAIVIDGHHVEQIVRALTEAKTIKQKPTIIIAHTLKGNGVSFYADNPNSHGSWAPSDSDYKNALAELQETRNRLVREEFPLARRELTFFNPQIDVRSSKDNCSTDQQGEAFEPYVFKKEEKYSLRNAFGMAAANLAKKYDNFDLFDGDVRGGTMTCIFEKHFPHRFIQCGIAEQNMMSVAAGYHLATERIPIVTTYAAFTSLLTAAQFRNNIAMQKLPVIVASSHNGTDTGPDGPTHQAIEDLGVFRTYPGVVVISAACPYQIHGLLEAALLGKKPVYMRTGRSPTPVLYGPSEHFSIGKDTVLRKGTDITFFATGLLVKRALDAAEQLSSEGIDAEVINIATLNPLDTQLILQSVRKTKRALVAEDHYLHNGLGGAISQFLGEQFPVPLRYIALRTYAESGDPQELAAKYHLTSNDIFLTAQEMIRGDLH